MRIVYSAGNRIGAGIQLNRFISAASKNHEIKIAAYIKSSYKLLHIDWTLDPLFINRAYKMHKIFGFQAKPSVNDKVISIINDIKKFKPDIIISDGEPVIANIAKMLGVKLWFCSPIHLLNGIDDVESYRYYNRLTKIKGDLLNYPEADRTFIYSPFGDINFRPILKKGFEWITPYFNKSIDSNLKYNCVCLLDNTNRKHNIFKILNYLPYKVAAISDVDYNSKYKNIDFYKENDYVSLLSGCDKILTIGETSFISDALYNGKNVCMVQSLDDEEALLNAMFVKEYYLGHDLAQVELMGKYALEEIENALSTPNTNNFLSKQDRPFLHEELV